jgi:hypothetical protein
MQWTVCLYSLTVELEGDSQFLKSLMVTYAKKLDDLGDTFSEGQLLVRLAVDGVVVTCAGMQDKGLMLKEV